MAIVDPGGRGVPAGLCRDGALVGLLTYVGVTLSPRSAADVPGAAAARGVRRRGPGRPSSARCSASLPALLLLAARPERAAAYLAIYIAARLLGASSSGSRLMGRRLGVHPAILVPGIVMVGQFGVLPLLLSAPIVAIVVDLVRYIQAACPSRPAGRRAAASCPQGTIATAARAPAPRTLRSVAARAGRLLAEPHGARPLPPPRRPAHRRRRPRHDAGETIHDRRRLRPDPTPTRRPAPPARPPNQLTQVRVPLEDAAEALATPDRRAGCRSWCCRRSAAHPEGTRRRGPRRPRARFIDLTYRLAAGCWVWPAC